MLKLKKISSASPDKQQEPSELQSCFAETCAHPHCVTTLLSNEHKEMLEVSGRMFLKFYLQYYVLLFLNLLPHWNTVQLPHDFQIYYCVLPSRLRLGQHFRVCRMDGSLCKRGQKSPCEAEEL